MRRAVRPEAALEITAYYARVVAVQANERRIRVKQPLDEAADVIMPDRGHLDNNPIEVSKQDIVKCLGEIVNENPLI
jgi:succinate semialdehyde reductase